MRTFKIISIILFALILLYPIRFFNRIEESISLIDNRKLFKKADIDKGDLTENIEKYVNDRIGGRNFFIKAYTLFNDKLFNVMVHPTYTYGKSGYVFFKQKRNTNYNDYHENFAEMVYKLSSYCKARNVPFVFVWNPSKTSVYRRFLSDGLIYNNLWVNKMLNNIRNKGVTVVDNGNLLEKISEKEIIFNKKYDAGHWNDLGCFYAVNNIYKTLKDFFPDIKELKHSDFEITKIKQTSLPVSEFPINEDVPDFKLLATYTDITQDWDNEIIRHPSFRFFNYTTVNNDCHKTKALFFHGSYFNSRIKFIIPNFKEKISIHNYQNILDLEYYFNIFQPDIVIFSVTEYTIMKNYFNLERIKQLDFNPAIDSETLKDYQKVEAKKYSVLQLNKTTIIKLKTFPDVKYAYLFLNGKIYDFKRKGDSFEITIAKCEKLDNAQIAWHTSDDKKYISELILE